MFHIIVGCFFFFFFQAEDGIRDYKVTGVQTCALPIYRQRDARGAHPDGGDRGRERAGGAARRSAVDAGVWVGQRRRPGDEGVARRGPECYWIGSPEITHWIVSH